MLIRLTRPITVDGDGDVGGFWGYSDPGCHLQKWCSLVVLSCRPTELVFW
jgi:hypothetical protein